MNGFRRQASDAGQTRPMSCRIDCLRIRLQAAVDLLIHVLAVELERLSVQGILSDGKQAITGDGGSLPTYTGSL